MTRVLALLAAVLFSFPAVAHEFVAGDLTIDHPHIPQPSRSAKAAGGYMSITNAGTTPDRLIGVEATFAAKASLHESRVDASGMGSMEPVAGVDIPPGATVSLESGGLHVMFLGLAGPLEEGERHKATLVFEKAGRVEVEFAVDPATTSEGGHDSHMTGSD